MVVDYYGIWETTATIEETIARLKRRRKGKRVAVIYFTVFKPRDGITEEDAVGILKTLRIRNTDFSIWVTCAKSSDTAYLDTMLGSMVFPSGSGQLQLGNEYHKDGERLVDITYIIIPRGNVKVDDVYALVRGLSDGTALRLGSSRYMVKMRVFGNAGELGKLRNRLTRLEVYDTYLLDDGREGELVVNLLAPSQVLNKGVYETVFGTLSY